MSGEGSGKYIGGGGSGTGHVASASTVDSVFTNAMADIFNSVIGIDAIFTPISGTAISCRVILERDVLMQPSSMDAQVYERGITIEAQLAEIINQPLRGDTFTVGAEVFTIKSIEENDGITVKMIVT